MSALLAMSLLGTACQRYPAPVPTGPIDAAAATSPQLPRTAARTAGDASSAAPKAATATSLLVELAPGHAPAAFQATAPAGFRVLRSLSLNGRAVLKATMPAGLSPEAAMARLAAHPMVRRAMPNRGAAAPAYRVQEAVAAPFGDAAYWYHQAAACDTRGAWGLVSLEQQADVLVAVLDSGIEPEHPAFTRLDGSSRVLGAFDKIGPDEPDPIDRNGHGTMVSGIIAANGGLPDGVQGVGWNLKLVSYRVSDVRGEVDDFALLDALVAVPDYRGPGGERVRVVNCSVTGYSGVTEALLQEAIDNLDAQGILVVGCAGNDNAPNAGDLTATSRAVSVGALAPYQGWIGLAPYSNYGARIDLVAPGDHVFSAVPAVNKYGLDVPYAHFTAGGTSAAGPYVSGVAALVCAKYDPDGTRMAEEGPAFTERLRQRLFTAVDDMGEPGKDRFYGHGRLNARKAVEPDAL